MARLAHWIALAVLSGLAALLAGCGASSPRVYSCGPPAYTFALPGGEQASSGDCPLCVSAPPPAVTIRRGQSFTMTPGDVASPDTPPVPRPNGPEVVVLSLRRTPHAGTRATYRAVEPGRALLVVHQATFCLPPGPKLGEPLGRYRRQTAAVKRRFLRRYRQEEQAQNRAREHPEPRNCPALAVRVTG